MKITNLSLAAIAAVAMTTGAMADIDMKIGGQAVVYYQTAQVEGASDSHLFEQDGSRANAGIQLNANADLGNDFGLGLQGTALSSWGLEKNVVSSEGVGTPANPGVMQQAGGDLDTTNAGDYFAITKAYLTKKIGNTTLKAGRQELPKSLSPLAFSEGWNAVKNTFDAVVAINTDIKDTTLVGAFVSSTNGNGFGNDMSTFGDLGALGRTVPMTGGAYMLTAVNKSIKDVAITGTYYALQDLDLNTSVAAPGANESGQALWLDVAAQNVGPVALGFQAGQIDPKNNLDKSNAYGAKVSGKAGDIALTLAYTQVDDGTVSMQNVGTGVKTPLFTQMVANQGAIASAAQTTLVKAAMPVGAGTLIAQYGNTNGTNNTADSDELDVIYKFKALGTNMLAAYVRANNKGLRGSGEENTANIVRVWSRYNF